MDINCMENGAHESDVDVFGGKGAHDADSESEMNVDDISETELSKIQLYDGIKKMLENSVEMIKRNRTERKKKRKRFNANVSEAFYNKEETKAYSRCSLPYLSKVIKSITSSDHRISLVKLMGFEDTLHIDDCYIPRLFAQWIADKTRLDEEVIKLDDKSIPINPKYFEDVLCIPAGHLPVETAGRNRRGIWEGSCKLAETRSVVSRNIF